MPSVSNNCNKFALLHDAQLKIYDDFEEAYSEFRSKIGIADKQITSAPKPEMSATSRKQIIEVTNSTALHDELFLNLVLEADIGMQAKKWEEGRRAFEKAFELYPYNGVYWNQWAHAVKEAGHYDLAEIGAPPRSCTRRKAIPSPTLLRQWRCQPTSGSAAPN